MSRFSPIEPKAKPSRLHELLGVAAYFERAFAKFPFDVLIGECDGHPELDELRRAIVAFRDAIPRAVEGARAASRAATLAKMAAEVVKQKRARFRVVR